MPDRARRDLGWTPSHSRLEEIVESAWLWVKGGRRYGDRKSRGD
jgi:UDP-glucose 4-epimerase